MLDLTALDHPAPYIKSLHQTHVGGGELATVVTLQDGKALVFAFGLMGVYESEEAYWDSEDGETGVIWMSEDGFCAP